MSMTGIILSIVLSGGISLFISHKFLRNRMGIGMAIMFLVPAFSCASYIYLTSPRFGSLLKASADTNEKKGGEQFNAENEGSNLPTKDEIAKLKKAFEQNPNDMDNIIALANIYISAEKYDDAIPLLESNKEADSDNKIISVLSTAYFSKGLLFAEQGRYEEALINLEKARDIAPENMPFLPDLDHFITIIKNTLNPE